MYWSAAVEMTTPPLTSLPSHTLLTLPCSAQALALPLAAAVQAEVVGTLSVS